MKLNAATLSDGYKLSHGKMYADGTTMVYSNLTPRSDRIHKKNATEFYDGKLVWVGAQGAIREIHEAFEEFFKSPKEKVVGRFARRMEGYLGGYEPAVKAISELHDLGYLPLKIKAIKEGSRVNFGIPVMSIRNTVPEFYWLTNYLETVISNLTWKVATNATIANEYRNIVEHYGDKTGTDAFTRSIQCHDFSMRGMSGPEDSARAGFGHLLSFIGTDTLPAMDYAEDYYDADGLIAISVPATEHAVATSNILKIETDLLGQGIVPNECNQRLTAETMFMYDLITRKFPTGIVSYVADSFDFWAVLTEILPALKDVILSREASNVAPGKLVIRPDSGDPVKVICGYELAGEVLKAGRRLMEEDVYATFLDGKWLLIAYHGEMDSWVDFKEVSEAEVKGAIQVLWETFGGTVTDKGYKLLDSHIGLIYGDSITTKRAEEILRRLADNGFASGNVVFGVGSYTYQCNTRDNFGFAVKATYTEVEGKGIAIFKDPKTDSKKKSAKGLLFVGYNTDNGGSFFLQDDVSREEEESDDNLLRTIFEDGKFFNVQTLSDVRKTLGWIV